MRDFTTGSPAGTTGSNDDSIRVAHTRGSGSSGIDSGGPSVVNNRPSKGEAPVRPIEKDFDMMDIDNSQSDLDDDNVTEYSFKSEDYPHDSELEDSDDEDARSHISLSDDEPEVPGVPDEIDWKALTRDQRVQYERMFGWSGRRPLNDSWTFTEKYHEIVDDQCMSYLAAFNPDEWVLSRPEVEYTLHQLLDRVRLRKAHTRVYGPHSQNHTSHSQPSLHHHPQVPFPLSARGLPEHQTMRHGPAMQPPPMGAKLGQPQQQPMAFAQSQRYQNGSHRGQPVQRPSYTMPGQMPGQMPLQPLQPLHSNMGPPVGPVVKPRKLKINGPAVRRESQAAVPLTAPTPPYPARDRPDQRKTVGKAGRGKVRRQAEADEFPWNRDLDFLSARDALQTKDSWDDSVYDAAMLAEMAEVRKNNEPVVAKLEDEITAKQSKSLPFCSKYLRLLLT